MADHDEVIHSRGQEARPFSELRETGLLWLINTTVFHPRGYALSLHVDDEGDITGWSLMGDGTERWVFSEDDETQGMCDALFLKAKELMP